MSQSNSSAEPKSVVGLDGIVAVVTGAGSVSDSLREPFGIGAATALLFAMSGARVMVVDRDEPAAARTLSLLEKLEPAVAARKVMRSITADVTDEAATLAVASAALAAFGPVTALVNNVGVPGPGGTALDLDLSEWDTAMRVNVGSMLLMSRAILPHMIGGGTGSIVNISSVAGIRGGHHALSYPTTKAAVVGLSTSMAAHHGPQGVRVNALAPGLAYTPMVTSRGLNEQGRERRRSAGMLKREGLAWDIACAAAFLVSDAGRWVTGTTIPVDGGISSLVNSLGVSRNG